MVWTIYSVGDGSFLGDVLEAIAMIFNSGITKGAFALALLLGVVYQGLKGTATAKGIDFTQILAVFLVYALFFIPRTTVAVEDSFTGTVYTVSHVPLGPAVAGSIISKAAHVFSVKFATAFGRANATSREISDPLMTLSRVRSAFVAVSRLGEVNNVGGGDFLSSWRNYFKECSNIGMDLGTLKVANLLENPEPAQAALFNSDVYGTSINVGGSNELLTCTEAHGRLLAYTRGPYMTKFLEALDKTELAVPASKRRADSAGVRNALNVLGLADTAVRDYVLAAVLLPVYREAAEGKHLEEGAFTAALMVREAKLARNTRFVAEESIYLKSVRIMLSFMEALIYAISPFMVLALGFGWGGLVMLGRYVQVLLWSAVMEPLMTVVNLFVLSAASHELSALSLPPASLKGLSMLLELTEDYVALGGLLMTSVPILAALVVYGSGQALSAVLAGTAGSSAISTSSAHPELSGKAAVTGSSPLFEKSFAGGVIKDGGRSYVADFSLSRGYEEAFSEASKHAQSARSAFSTSLSQVEQSVFGSSVTTESLSRTGASIMSSRAESSGTVTSLSRGIAESMGLDSRQENALRGAIGSVLSGGSSDTGLLSSLTLGASGGTSNGETLSRLTSELNGISKDESLRAAFTKSVSRDVASGVTTGFTESKSKGLNSALADTAEKAVAAEESLASLKSSKASLGAAFSMDGASLAKATAENDALFRSIGKHITGSDQLTARTRGLAERLGEFYPNSKQAYVAAAYTAMLESEPRMAYSFMAQALGTNATRGVKGSLQGGEDGRTVALAGARGSNSEIGAMNTALSANQASTQGLVDARLNKENLATTNGLNGGTNLEAWSGLNMDSSINAESIGTPEGSYSNWKQEIEPSFLTGNSETQAKKQAYLEEAVQRPIGTYNVRSPVDTITAAEEAQRLGLSGASSEVYMSFATGGIPNADKISEIKADFGGGDVGNGALRRLRAAALSGDESMAKPVSALGKMHVKR